MQGGGTQSRGLDALKLVLFSRPFYKLKKNFLKKILIYVFQVHSSVYYIYIYIFGL